jgi:hypothetical protein
LTRRLNADTRPHDIGSIRIDIYTRLLQRIFPAAIQALLRATLPHAAAQILLLLFGQVSLLYPTETTGLKPLGFKEQKGAQSVSGFDSRAQPEQPQHRM